MNITAKEKARRQQVAQRLLQEHGGRPPAAVLAKALGISAASAGAWWRANMASAKPATTPAVAPGSALGRLLAPAQDKNERRFVAAVHLLGVAKARAVLADVKRELEARLA